MPTTPQTHNQPRIHTPDRPNDDGSTTIKLKRACNGCGQHLGDVDDRDITDHGGLTDVRRECDHCAPLVALEAAGCKTWRLTERSYPRVDWELDRLDVFAKQYTECDEIDGRIVTVGMRIGVKPGHVVAYFGDWIVRHPDGRWSVHAAPAAGEAQR
jgi:hypothetical protein